MLRKTWVFCFDYFLHIRTNIQKMCITKMKCNYLQSMTFFNESKQIRFDSNYEEITLGTNM